MLPWTFTALYDVHTTISPNYAHFCTITEVYNLHATTSNHFIHFYTIMQQSELHMQLGHSHNWIKCTLCIATLHLFYDLHTTIKRSHYWTLFLHFVAEGWHNSKECTLLQLFFYMTVRCSCMHENFMMFSKQDSAVQKTHVCSDHFWLQINPLNLTLSLLMEHASDLS